MWAAETGVAHSSVNAALGLPVQVIRTGGSALCSSFRLEEALSDCSLALKHFRGNSVIDYRQLGLRYKLHSWQVTLYTLLTHWASNAATSRGATVVKARLIYRHI